MRSIPELEAEVTYRQAQCRKDAGGRRLFAAGVIRSKEEQRLRKAVREAKRAHEDHPDHGTEIDLAIARRDLEEFLEDRGRA